eukprot:TRINITY_DN24474_c0_g1_i1.p1 TRINITY_DN24474_c0_g1~~TRINITY_DN24474_c0_g1_i1.p1  ORF type:complete len:151 (-),score=35.36 TRINITY_DN24474_c0_g1_i1:101-520(-)
METSAPARADPLESKEKLEEAKHAALVANTTDMFNKVYEYFQSELEGTVEDFTLLENMNTATKEKYAEMTLVAKALTTFMENLQNKYKDFEPYLRKIEEIDNNVGELERTVGLLDDYTKRLEEKFKKLAAQKREVLNKR